MRIRDRDTRRLAPASAGPSIIGYPRITPHPARHAMQIPVPDDLITICREIVAEGKSDAEWAEIEAGDWFQADSVTGGYEADEHAFTFSVHTPDGGELWVVLTLGEAAEVARGTRTTVEARPPD